jgi:hypothetical protein
MRVERDFNQRTPQERRWLLENSWCDNCQEADLGMKDPKEYQEDGVLYVEGRCVKCESIIRSSAEERNVG